MKKPSRAKETHYNRPAKPAGTRKPAEKKDRPAKPRPRREDGEGGDQPLGRKAADRSRPAGGRPGREERPDRGFKRDRPAGPREDRPERSFRKETPKRDERPERGFKKDAPGRADRPDKGFKKDFPNREDRPEKGTFNKPRREEGEKRPYSRARPEGGDRPYARKKDTDQPKRQFREEGASGEGGEGGRKRIERKPREAGFNKRREAGQGAAGRGAYPRKGAPATPQKDDFEDQDFYEDERPFLKSGKWNEQAKAGPMTLNKYLAHAGVSSRRETAAIVKEGRVKVNGQVVKEPGYRVQDGDTVMLDGKVMTPQKHMVYVLLNKPKDFLTTTEDDRGRRTVMELVANAGADRLFPVGRLDRNTTGVLLLTNDGDLAQKLSHPSYEIKKIYQVTLDKDLTKKDFDKILGGVELEDGPAQVDRLAYLEKKSEIGLEIHSGRNRIVRRIFESLGYNVEKLDRVMYAGLTKKNVTRGQWRFLTEKEVIHLKHFRHR